MIEIDWLQLNLLNFYNFFLQFYFFQTVFFYFLIHAVLKLLVNIMFAI